MNSSYLILTIILIHGISCKLVIPSLDLTYRTGHLTPTGYNHPQMEPLTGILSLELEGVDPSAYIGTILLMPFRPNWDIDVCMYNNLGVSCVIVTDTSPYVPGFIIVKGYNECKYTCALSVSYPEFEQLANLYVNTTIASNFTQFLMIDIDSTDGNEWKEMSDSAPFYLVQILGGLSCLVILGWNCYTLARLSSLQGMQLRNHIVIATFLIISGVLGILGFVDFTCFRQLMPHRACTVLTSSRITFIFGPCWFLIFIMMETAKASLKIEYGISDKTWLFSVIVGILIANDIICSVVLTYLSVPADIYTLIVIWLGILLGLALVCSILMAIVSVKTLKRMQGSMTSSSARKEKLTPIVRRLMIILSIISVSLLGYVINAAAINYAINYPYSLAASFLIYTTLLNIIAISLTYNVYRSVMNHIEKIMKTSSRGSSENKTDLTSSTKQHTQENS